MNRIIRKLDDAYKEIIETYKEKAQRDETLSEVLEAIDKAQYLLTTYQENNDSTCDDCMDSVENVGELRSWKYEPEVKLCENCYQTRINEED